MKRNRTTSPKRNKKKIFIILLVVIFIALLVVFILDRTNTVELFGNNSKPESTQEDKDATTTSKTPSAQSDYTDGDERQPGNTLNENKGTSVIRDTNGNIPGSVNTSNPITSSTGEITAYTPGANSIVKSGQVVAGASTLPKITYRVIDDISGMIAMGDLSVVNGKFSGTIAFDTTAKTGRIDIFATKSDGSEYSTVEIPIKFR